MKMIVGLGNPGKKYDNTRHNVGFEVVGELARRWRTDSFREKYQALLTEAVRGGEKVLLLAPQTYMNLSGVAVRLASDFYKAAASDLLVVCDDFNLPLGTLRMRARGSAGGQNGLDNIIQQLGTQDFARLRFGIGPVPERWSTVDYVLGKFPKDEHELVGQTLHRAADAVECWIANGATETMNQYN
jgi:peptidyl-tRNA hydrolase, PTH1 family